MICHYCNQDIEIEQFIREYELKKGGTVNVCINCENSAEIYLDKIKRECLINGVSYKVTSSDEKTIKIERKLRLECEEEERIFGSPKSIFYVSNEPLKKPEMNHQVLRYINEFVGKDDTNEDHVQRFKFKHYIGEHWYIEEAVGLTGINIYLDNMSKEYQRYKKPEDKEWKERVRRWYSGRLECNEDFYNVTFGFSQYDNEPCGEVYVSYNFICSKSYKIARLIEELLREDGWNIGGDK